MTTAPGYAFDNNSAQAPDHHTALAELLDPATRQRISELVSLPGRRCLEVAAGGGSVAVWLAAQASAVVATDLKPQHIPRHPRLTVREHDITSGAPPGRFDLVHARLLLNHLPERDLAVRHMVDALSPGGVLLTEDFLPTTGAEVVAHAPDPRTAALLARYQTLHTSALASHGNDRSWSRRAHSAFYASGLTDVRVYAYATEWRGGGPGCRLLRAGIGQLRDDYLSLGMTDLELAEIAGALMNPDVALNGYLTIQTSGRQGRAQGITSRSTATRP
jgi:SAM-dependent methyltransferase